MTTNFKTIQVVTRFALRILMICALSTFGNVGFGPSLATLLLLSAIVCVVTGIWRREPPFRNTLTNWDEAVVYGLLCALTTAFNQTPPL
jgi:hypothetical protein